MSELNALMNEISGLFSNPGNMEKDITEAYGLMREHLHNKYTKKIYDAFEACHLNTKENPPPEVKLLNAWKPFVTEDFKGKINEMTDMLYKAAAIKEISNGMGGALAAANGGADPKPDNNISAASAHHTNDDTLKADSSIHPDGVYDIDESCYYDSYRGGPGMGGITGLLLLCAIMNR